MTVLLSNGHKRLKVAVGQVLDTFLTDQDFDRGIFIKPNVVFAVKPGSGEITSPNLVRKLVESLRERRHNIEILLGEGVAAGCDPHKNFHVSGFAKLARELDVPLLDLNTVERQTVASKFGRLELPRVALERTYINLPILKSSSACVISGALKNQKGLILPSVKKHFHRLGLHEQIAELNSIVKPALSILDCNRFFGRNVLISGDNCGEIDSIACELLQIEEPEHVQLARNAKVFASGFSVTGDSMKRRRLAGPAVREFKRLGRLRLWSNPQACTMCRYLFQDIQQNMHKRQNFLVGLKLLIQSVKGAEIIMGLNPYWRKEYSKVICIGACTQRIAKEGNFIYIPGCPPTLKDLEKKL